MTGSPTTLDVRPLAGALGAEVRGIRLGALDEPAWTALRHAWLGIWCSSSPIST